MMRPTCLTCFRPEDLCLCSDTPTVPNQTGIIVLQHARERFHPFGSARMLVRALRRARLEVVHGARPAAATNGRFAQVSLHHPMSLPPRTGLLYPHPDARALAGLDPAERPRQLVLLDGTWAHAKRLYDDNPWLHALPHYAIAPRQPSRYLVRREPNASCVSTLEAAVEALQHLEPELPGAEALLALFARMNTEQVARQRQSPRARPRPKAPQTAPRRAVPAALRSGPVVCLYAETAEVVGADERGRDSALFVVHARRESTPDGGGMEGEAATWHAFLPTPPPTERYLEKAGLAACARGAADPDWRRGLAAFLRPGDTLVTWSERTFGLLPAEATRGHVHVALRGVYCNVRRMRSGPLAEVVAREGLRCPPPGMPGRPGKHVVELAGLTRWLRAM